MTASTTSDNFGIAVAIWQRRSSIIFEMRPRGHRLVHTCTYEALVQNTHKVMKDALLFLGCRAGPIPKKIRRLDVHRKAMGDKNMLNTKSPQQQQQQLSAA